MEWGNVGWAWETESQTHLNFMKPSFLIGLKRHALQAAVRIQGGNKPAEGRQEAGSSCSHGAHGCGPAPWLRPCPMADADWQSSGHSTKLYTRT